MNDAECKMLLDLTVDAVSKLKDGETICGLYKKNGEIYFICDGEKIGYPNLAKQEEEHRKFWESDNQGRTWLEFYDDPIVVRQREVAEKEDIIDAVNYLMLS